MIGPHLFGIRDKILPLQILINDIPVNYKYNERNFIKVLVPIQYDYFINKKIKINIQFSNLFNVQLILYENNNGFVISHLTTLQKNNKLKWIQDYINYYSRHIGVELITIYDNNSDNFFQLFQSVINKKKIKTNLKLIQWNFVYDGKINDKWYNSCQCCSLTHAYYKFGKCDFFLNFDIDELINPRIRLETWVILTIILFRAICHLLIKKKIMLLKF